METGVVIDGIKALEADGDSAAALDRALQALERSPQDPALIATTCGLLDTWERFDESLAIIERATDLDPLQATTLRAATHGAMNSLDEALALHREVHRAAPTDRRGRFDYIRMLIRTGAFEQADREIAEFAEANPRGNHWKLHIHCLNAQQRRVEALEVAEEIWAGRPEKIDCLRTVLRQLHKCIQKDRSPAARRRAEELLDGLTSESVADANALRLYIRLAVALGRVEQATRLLASDTGRANPAYFRRERAWVAAEAGQVDEARRIWDEIRAAESVPTIRPCRPDELDRLDTHPIPGSADEIRVFTVIRNELWRLPWFLDHYRALGVDRFFFVDNDSTDGSRAWLLTQPDVHVFHTTTPYARGRSGMVWVNDLVATYATDGWFMYVDVDEALVFDGVETRGLRALTAYMEREGHDMATGQMIDMFSVEDSGVPPGGFEHDFIARYPYFDCSYERTPTVQCPYFFTSGGIRRLVRTGENQTKTPLIRGGRNIQFLSSSHIVTPGVVSDVEVALLHFKLAGDYRAQFRDDGDANDRVGECKLRYQAYAEFFESWAGGAEAVAASETTARYASSRTLVDAGLIPPTPDGVV